MKSIKETVPQVIIGSIVVSVLLFLLYRQVINRLSRKRKISISQRHAYVRGKTTQILSPEQVSDIKNTVMDRMKELRAILMQR